MKKLLFIAICVILHNLVFAQTFTVEVTPQWQTPYEITNSSGEADQIIDFKDAAHFDIHPTLPSYSVHFPLNSYGKLDVVLEDAVFEPMDRKANIDDAYIKSSVEVNAEVHIDRRQFVGKVNFIPIRKNELSGKYERLVSGTLTAKLQSAPYNFKQKRNGIISVLNDGDIYRIAVTNTGIHKLDYDFLELLGVDVDNINPQNIQLYGNGGGMLPELNSEDRPEDLTQNPILVIGEDDGSFDKGDYILFYGESQDKWYYNADSISFFKKKHLYSNQNYYFIKIASSQGLRVGNATQPSTASFTTNTFNDYAHHQEDIVNVLDLFRYTHGSGREWYGESFLFTPSRDFTFDFPGRVQAEPVRVRSQVIARSIGQSSAFNMSVNNGALATKIIGSVSTNIEHAYARLGLFETVSQYGGENINVNLGYQKGNSESEGWLNFVEVNVRRALQFGSGQMTFRDARTIEHSAAKYEIASSNGNSRIWDVTDFNSISNINFNTSGGSINFFANAGELREYIIFDETNLFAADTAGQVVNQNIHGITPPEFLVVYHKKFESEAQRFSQHRSEFSDMSIAMVEVEEIYNEFSSGKQDPTAIRDFVKYLYDQNGTLKHLLLFGDGSFDQRNQRNDPENHHYVALFETKNSLDPILSYVSDDFFGLLDESEGDNINTGSQDISIGRFPVRTLTEAKDVVDKIISYDSDPVTYRDWKNRVTFVADDEDNNLHINDADGIAQSVANNNPVLNVDKIYLDAFPQIATQGGNRYPDANLTLNTNIFKGNFTVNYMGHGDDEGWTQERVMNVSDISQWNNKEKLPLFVTATCSFAPYDAPHKVSAGELLLLNPDGGAVALFTTVRAVYASSNRKLTDASFDNIFNSANVEKLPIGEILRKAKNESGAGVQNSRKFALLGDPSMTLAYPTYDVVTTHINDSIVTVGGVDTIGALQEVKIRGFVADENGSIVSDFNGTVYPTVFDKVRNVKTRVNDPTSVEKTFKLQKNVIFKGRATVANGEFEFSFVVPKDIDYEFGLGKISYYAEDGVNREANGYYKGIAIGGTYANATDDDTPPIVEVFMNDEKFVFGGMTDNAPILFVKLSDDKGINTVGTGIGHDITGVMDNNTQNTFVLNDFYEAEVDNPRGGIVRFPLSELADGRHQVSVKAWDIANNSGVGMTEFVVASSEEMALSKVLNYPNPFTTNTSFQFEHNYPGQDLTVQVQIFSTSGELVKTIQKTIFSEGYRVDDIEWDGLDDFGQPIGRGVYVYRVSVGIISDSGTLETSESAFEKLVILR